MGDPSFENDLPGPSARSCTPAHSRHLICVQANGGRSLPTDGDTPMFKVTPNPPESTGAPAEESLDTATLDKEAADRVFAHYFPSTNDKHSKRRKGRLFTVSNDIDSEALLANASEDMLSISAIAAKLADDVEGSNRSVALALSRIADGAQLMVERALDHLEELVTARQEAKT